MQTPGKILLKIASVLLIVFGAIATIISMVVLLGGTMIAVPLRGAFFFSVVVGLMLSILELVIGVIGFKRSDDAQSANFFIVSGAVLSVTALVSLVLSFQVMGLIGFVLPISFIVGGTMNKNTLRTT